MKKEQRQQAHHVLRRQQGEGEHLQIIRQVSNSVFDGEFHRADMALEPKFPVVVFFCVAHNSRDGALADFGLTADECKRREHHVRFNSIEAATQTVPHFIREATEIDPGCAGEGSISRAHRGALRVDANERLAHRLQIPRWREYQKQLVAQEAFPKFLRRPPLVAAEVTQTPAPVRRENVRYTHMAGCDSAIAAMPDVHAR